MSYAADFGRTVFDPAPDYVAITRSNTTTTGSSTFSRSLSVDNLRKNSRSLSLGDRPSSARRTTRHAHERYEYAYDIYAASAKMQFVISVEPVHGTPTPGKYTLTLSLRVNKMTRSLSEPVTLKLSVDPRQLNFVVFLIPGKTSLPVGTLFSYRVWLRVNEFCHRLFGEDDLWIGKDPDFSCIADASFARLRRVLPSSQVYDALVGRAKVQFIIRWHRFSECVYDYSLEYECCGVGAVLFEDLRLKLECDPREVTFCIYTVPLKSLPVGASHRLRVWIKTSCSGQASEHTMHNITPFTDSHIYQRVWKSDTLKIGARLDFDALSSKMTMGYMQGGPKTVITTMSSSVKKRFGYTGAIGEESNEPVEI
ncbi:uncharacterized protein BT62DRAFT_784581 [Guyanagaster necrorhizus]|uniref:Uncharacterized protein n=1 Tax=Guyanagaster necrorhizus TaxID=856835 RepID=A0A9P8ATW1_9AGAR|nr:uncharacterized protein BT62DRAFT_784581 [Guyanagaster necrorhizus MCA 3950]KAG7447620.1 hypothetical protein BT62DRAFT_784581 [Guyanagaster necrorhizus MCA 3950]